MYSMIFLSILLLTQHSIVCQNSMKYQICKEKDLSIDSAFRPLETDFVYLFFKNFFCKLKIISENQSVIESANELSFWSKEIKAPIHIVTTDVNEINYISLINTAVKTQWDIRYEDDHYNGSRSPKTSWEPRDIENVILKVGQSFKFLVLENSTDYLDLKTREGCCSGKYLRQKPKSNADNESMLVKIIPEHVDDAVTRAEMARTKPFTNLNGHWISAGFIRTDIWYLFGGKYYCRLKLSDLSYEECKPNLITDWIQDCKGLSDQKNKDVSVLAIVLVCITALGILTVVIIGLFIHREYKRQNTSAFSRQSFDPNSH